MKATKIAPHGMALLWTCTHCGFVKEGGQPHMECPSCEAYKTSFIDLPQHLEVAVRDKLGKKKLPNCTEGRQMRLALMQEHGFHQKFQVKGRFLP